MTVESINVRHSVSAHGPTGHLLRSLQRYAVLGWLLFAITGVLFATYVFITVLQPPQTVVVNESGQIIGQLEYFDERARPDSAVVATAKYFMSHHLSVSAATVYDDKAIALSMMSEALRERELENLAATDFFATVEKVNNLSRIEFVDTGEVTNRVQRRDGRQVEVLLNGNVVLGLEDPKRVPFRAVLTLQLTPRRHASGSAGAVDSQVEGVIVEAIRDV